MTLSNQFVGGRENNHTLKAFIKTRNLDGLEAKVTIDVKVREPKKISDKDLSDAISQLSQAVNEQDNEKALSMLHSFLIMDFLIFPLELYTYITTHFLVTICMGILKYGVSEVTPDTFRRTVRNPLAW